MSCRVLILEKEPSIRLQNQLQKITAASLAHKKDELLIVPPPVKPEDEEYIHDSTQSGKFPAELLLEKIEQGITLIEYLQFGVLIRVVGNIVFLFKKDTPNSELGKYGVMKLGDFLTAYSAELEQYLSPRITYLLTIRDRENFLFGPVTMTISEAAQYMRWDNSQTSKKPQKQSNRKNTAELMSTNLVQAPPLYVHLGGRFDLELFERLLSSNFTCFADQNTYVVTNGDIAHIYIGDAYGIYVDMNMAVFFEEFRQAQTETFSERVSEIIKGYRTVKMKRIDAFRRMKLAYARNED